MANDARLALALESSDVQSAAAIVLSELPETWRPEQATERDVQHLISLAHVIGNAGNVHMRAGIAKKLAAAHPDLQAGITNEDNRSVAQVADSWQQEREALDAASSHIATFDESVLLTNDLAGEFEPLGLVPARPGDRGRVAIFADDQRLIALDDSPSNSPRWKAFLSSDELPRSDPWGGRYAFAPGKLVVATNRRVVAIDADDGTETWSWSSDVQGLKALRASDGVAVAIEDLHPESNARSGEYLAVGLDMATGTELWRLRLDGQSFHTANPICGSGYLVFLPQNNAERAEVRDLFTGRAVSTFKISKVFNLTAFGSWIEDERLIVPRFLGSTRPDLNHISAIELATGRELWRYEFDRGNRNELQRVIQEGGRTYLVLRPARSLENRMGGIFELNTRSGAISSTPIVALRESDRLMGFHNERVALDHPFLFVLAEPQTGNKFSVQAIHLPYGPRWRATLPVTEEDMHTGRMPLPAVSESTVAIAWLAYKSGSRRAHWELTFMDRANGRFKDSRMLSDSSRPRLHLSPLGDALVLCGAQRMEVLR